jgi:hypothetical protein
MSECAFFPARYLETTSPANETATFGVSLLLLLGAGNRRRGGSNDLLPASNLMKI